MGEQSTHDLTSSLQLTLFSSSETRSYDVRTKRITHQKVPVVDDVVAIANYGANGALFTVSRNHGVQQYDLVAEPAPVMAKQAFHVPHNAPPTPPGSTEIVQAPRVVPVRRGSGVNSAAMRIPIQIDTDTSASEDEGPVLSPLQRIAREMDDLEDERRDQLAPLSPVSSRASMSSASSYGGRRRRNRAQSRASRTSSQGSGGTVFSGGSSERTGNDSMSIHSGTSTDVSTSRRQPSSLRNQTMRSPEHAQQIRNIDLFPYLKAQLGEVKFRPPRYEEDEVTPDILRVEMLNVVFGWEGDIVDLVRDEQSRHHPHSPAAVLLSKWLGDPGADDMAQTLSSETMSSSDWMLLAMCNKMGGSSGKQIGENYVKNLLTRDEIHPAVTILMGLGDLNEAVEVYVSRKYYMEAVLLTCLCFPHDWQRQSFLVRKWGEVAVTHGQPELAVRCFSCTAIECSEAWFSPKSQDLVYQAQQQILAPDQTRSPVSPPSASGSNRMTTKNASLKLITTFGEKGAPKPQLAGVGATPIAESAITPGAGGYRSNSRGGIRDLSETRTATPGGYRKNRMPSATRQADMDAQPLPEGAFLSRRATPALSEATTDEIYTTVETAHPLARAGSADPYRPHSRPESRDRNKHGLHIVTGSTTDASLGSPGTSVVSASVNSVVSRGRHRRTASSIAKAKLNGLDVQATDEDAISPGMPTGGSLTSYKGRSIDRYISSLEEANYHAQQQRAESRSRNENRDAARSRSRPRVREGSKARTDVSYGATGKRSPTSPKSMTAEDVKIHSSRKRDDDLAASPIEPKSAKPRAGSKVSTSRVRGESPESRSGARTGSRVASRNASRANNRPDLVLDVEPQQQSSRRHSPTSPVAMESHVRAKSRARSSSRKPSELANTPLSARARSSSRKPKERYGDEAERSYSPESVSAAIEDRQPRTLSRKELAAKELEERRLSLARRPSAPAIPRPGSARPDMSPRSATEGDLASARSFLSSYDGQRSQTVDPDSMGRFHVSKSSTSSMPVGLPATPKAMRLPNGEDDIPAVPALPDLQTLAPVSYQPKPQDPDNMGPLLPPSVFGQRPPMRSASAPPEKFTGTQSPLRSSPENRTRRESNASRTQKQSVRSRHPSEDYSHSFLDTSDDVIIVPESAVEPPVLAELAHLAGPPPPPPPPAMYGQPPPPPPAHSYRHSQSQSRDPSGVISIAIDSRNTSPKDPASATAASDTGMAPLPLTTANLSRRNAEQTSASASAGGGGSRWARVADKMRSTSRSRNAAKSPSVTGNAGYGNDTSPYETVLPSMAFNRTRSPQSESGGFGHANHGMRKPTPAPYETTVESSPEKRIAQNGLHNANVMRNPKDIRANMPPTQLPAGGNFSEWI